MQKIDCIYIINLKKERSRLKQTLLLLADEYLHIPIKIFEATYWDSEFFKNELYENKIHYSKIWRENGNKIKKGQIACCYSHLQLLQDVVDNNYQTILLLQDDVYCENIGDLKDEIDKFHNLIQKHNDFDLYYVGKQKVFSNIEEKKFRDTDILETEYCYNAHCLIFSRECCLKLLNTDIRNNIIPFDEFLPLCFGKSMCANLEYFSDLFPKIITALSSDTFSKMYQCTHYSSRYKHLVDTYSFTDISESEIVE